jgi:hypothetical protein
VLHTRFAFIARAFCRVHFRVFPLRLTPLFFRLFLSRPPPALSPAQLPPPSYADSVYFDRAEITPDTSPTAAHAAAHAVAGADAGTDAASFAPGSGGGAGAGAGGVLLVAVSSPEKRSDAGSALGRLTGKKYVTFAVAFRAEALRAYERAPAGAPRRRFRDFVGLAARLVRRVS